MTVFSDRSTFFDSLNQKRLSNMDTVILILNLSVAIIGIVHIWFGYQKDKAVNPEDKASIGKRIVILALVMAVGNSIAIPVMNLCKPKAPPPVTKQDIEQIVAKYMGEKPKNPPIEEFKSEIEKEVRAATEKKIEAYKKGARKALQQYEKGNDAYKNKRFKEAIRHFKTALQIVQTSS